MAWLWCRQTSESGSLEDWILAGIDFHHIPMFQVMDCRGRLDEADATLVPTGDPLWLSVYFPINLPTHPTQLTQPTQPTQPN